MVTGLWYGLHDPCGWFPITDIIGERLRNGLRRSGEGAGVQPEIARDLERVDPACAPPLELVAGLVHLVVMEVAERHGELVADLARQGPRLREAQVMGLCRLTAAHETGLPRDEPQMVGRAQSLWLADRQGALVDGDPRGNRGRQ